VRVKILIVEDNRHMRRMLMEMVGAAFEPHPVLEAADASSALLLSRVARPDLVLMDVGLPDGNGIEVTAEIKSLLPASRIVIVSNHRDRAAQDAARTAGAVAYVFKDEVYDKLLPTLALVLGDLAPPTLRPPA
jgi:DNA-binding NarL/FixJ family response regulator